MLVQKERGNLNRLDLLFYPEVVRAAAFKQRPCTAGLGPRASGEFNGPCLSSSEFSSSLKAGSENESDTTMSAPMGSKGFNKMSTSASSSSSPSSVAKVEAVFDNDVIGSLPSLLSVSHSCGVLGVVGRAASMFQVLALLYSS